MSDAQALAVERLIKLRDRKLLTLDQFLQLSAELTDEADAPSVGASASSSEAGSSQHASAAAATPSVDASDGADSSTQPFDLFGEENEDNSSETAAAEPALKRPKITGSLMDFMRKNAPAEAVIAGKRKVQLSKHHEKKEKQAAPEGAVDIKTVRCKNGRGASTQKQGTRKNDVSAHTMLERIRQTPNQSLVVAQGQLFCVACGKNVGSGKGPVEDHIGRPGHVAAMLRWNTSKVNNDQIKVALHEYVDKVKEEHGEGASILGLEKVAMETQVARAETLEEFLKAGIEPLKIDHMRGWLERKMGISLTGRAHMMNTFVPPLKLKEEAIIKAEFKGEFIGCYHDGTTHCGESFAIVYRACKAGFIFRISCVRLRFLRGSMTADQISSVLLDTTLGNMQVNIHLPPARARSHTARSALL